MKAFGVKHPMMSRLIAHSPGKSLSLWHRCWVLIVIRIVTKTPKWAVSCANSSWARAPLEKFLDHRLGIHTDGNWTDGATTEGQPRGEVRRCRGEPWHPDLAVTPQSLCPELLSPTRCRSHVAMICVVHTGALWRRRRNRRVSSCPQAWKHWGLMLLVFLICLETWRLEWMELSSVCSLSFLFHFHKMCLYFTISDSEDEEILNNEEHEYASPKRTILEMTQILSIRSFSLIILWYLLVKYVDELHPQCCLMT